MQDYGIKDRGRDLRDVTVSGKLKNPFERANPSGESWMKISSIMTPKKSASLNASSSDGLYRCFADCG
jgi:hypothetical protein